MGMTGPMSRYLGYGPNFNALVGIAAMDGYEGETPDTAGENYHMDEAAPAGLAFAVLAALWDRERTGRGGLVEFPQAECVMAEVGEFVLDYQMNDAPRRSWATPTRTCGRTSSRAPRRTAGWRCRCATTPTGRR